MGTQRKGVTVLLGCEIIRKGFMNTKYLDTMLSKKENQIYKIVFTVLSQLRKKKRKKKKKGANI